VDWRLRQIQVYRSEDARLVLSATLYDPDALCSPLLPGFSCRTGQVFRHIPHSVPDVAGE
jgi:Uma2 family endonuclease